MLLRVDYVMTIKNIIDKPISVVSHRNISNSKFSRHFIESHFYLLQSSAKISLNILYIIVCTGHMIWQCYCLGDPVSTEGCHSHLAYTTNKWECVLMTL